MKKWWREVGRTSLHKNIRQCLDCGSEIVTVGDISGRQLVTFEYRLGIRLYLRNIKYDNGITVTEKKILIV